MATKTSRKSSDNPYQEEALPSPPDILLESSALQRVIVQVDEAYRADVDATDLAEAVAATLISEECPDLEVSLVITDDEVMEALNRQFRGIEGPTDVLSFSAQEPTPGFVSAPEAAGYLGDIVIALPFTRRQATELRRPLVEELRLLAVHGTLHLLGYDHAEPDEEVRMWARQDEILAALRDRGSAG